MEKAESTRLKVIKLYEDEIEYLKKNLLKKTELGVWITPRLIKVMKIRLYEIKTGKTIKYIPVIKD